MQDFNICVQRGEQQLGPFGRDEFLRQHANGAFQIGDMAKSPSHRDWIGSRPCKIPELSALHHRVAH